MKQNSDCGSESSLYTKLRKIRHYRHNYSRWIAVICFCIFMYWFFFVESSDSFNFIKTPGTMKRKLILDWTTFFGKKLVNEPTLELLGCQVTSCNFTNDRSLLEYSDAVMFHLYDIKLNEMPKKKNKQRWILRNYECPLTVSSNTITAIEDSIDWTATYKRDSDLPSYYGQVRARIATDPPPVPIPDKKSFSQKKAIAWMVSDCGARSKRDNIVKELEKFIDVDIYGTCPGGDKSLRGVTANRGFEKLSEKYKLYLSFENTLCRDYATEKIFMPLHHGIIPVVWGGANYREILPRNSYIDVLDFPSVKELASHLKKVIEDYDVYASYFKWREDYFVAYREISPRYLCDICARLFSDESYNVKRKTSLTSWWNKEKDCIQITESAFSLPQVRNSLLALYDH